MNSMMLALSALALAIDHCTKIIILYVPYEMVHQVPLESTIATATGCSGLRMNAVLFPHSHPGLAAIAPLRFHTIHTIRAE
jgi:hypothetical protein